jgi:hypothetical protein
MSELRFPSAATWAEFNLKTKLISPPIIRLKIKPVFRRVIAQIVYGQSRRGLLQEAESLFATFDRQAQQAAQLVEDWELCYPNNEPIPCTDENKRLYLAELMWEYVDKQDEEPDDAGDEPIELGGDEPKDKKKPSPTWLFGAIIDFAINPENFLKN